MLHVGQKFFKNCAELTWTCQFKLSHISERFTEYLGWQWVLTWAAGINVIKHIVLARNLEVLKQWGSISIFEIVDVLLLFRVEIIIIQHNMRLLKSRGTLTINPWFKWKQTCSKLRYLILTLSISTKQTTNRINIYILQNNTVPILDFLCRSTVRIWQFFVWGFSLTQGSVLTFFLFVDYRMLALSIFIVCAVP